MCKEESKPGKTNEHKMQNMSGKLSLFLTGFDFVHYNGFWSQVCESDELSFSVDIWKLKVAGASSFSK